MKQYSVLLLVAGGMTLSSTFAAYAMMDVPSSREMRTDKVMNMERAHTTSETETSSEKLRPRCNEANSNTGAVRCAEVKNGTGSENKMERLQERKKLQQEKAKQMKIKWEMRDAIIDKLLAGESLSDTEKAEAKVMLAERKERYTEVKNRVEEVKASWEKVWPMKRVEIRKEVRKDMREDRKMEDSDTNETK